MTVTFLKQGIMGARNFKTISIMIVLFLGGLGFFLAGLSSYFHVNFLLVTNTENIIFIPQGITLLFYGTGGLVLAFFLFCYICWDVGSGYNEFSEEDKTLRIIRRGFPGKNRNLFLSYDFNNIKILKLIIKQGLNPRSNILVVLKDKREIPLFPPQFYLKPSEMEKRAIELSNFLRVKLETLKTQENF